MMITCLKILEKLGVEKCQWFSVNMAESQNHWSAWLCIRQKWLKQQ